MPLSITDFVEKIIPGNYWLTKSMEFSKVNSSGTLWYLKKWIVYYKYLFFKDSITQVDYNEIRDIFISFIDSLPDNEDVRQNAENFFFEIDIRNNESFLTLNDFLNNIPNLSTPKELQQYIVSAKRFYFIYIMNVGGQSGYKKDIKEWIIEKNSYYSVLEKLKGKLVLDNKELEYGMLISDFPASLRNERQIFFYYGLFHGNEKADLSGFYNLTNIGKSIINASFDELLLIWEHQKIKMISQSPLTDIQKLSEDIPINSEKFNTCFHPYVSFLEIMVNNNAITLDEYQYVISRVSQEDDLKEISDSISDILEKSQVKISSFNRIADKKDEDFKKELAKFILGISEMKKDEGSNYFSFLTKYTNKKISVSDLNKAKFVLKNYKYITNYLDEQYMKRYNQFQNELRNKYNSSTNSQVYEIDINLKYEWSKYIINLDKNLYFGLIYILCSLKISKYDYCLDEIMFGEEFNNFKSLLKSFGIKKKVEFVNLMMGIQDTFKVENKLLVSVSEDAYSMADLINLEIEVSVEKLSEISRRASVNNVISRKRDTTLIQTLKTYYNKYYLTDERLIKCDCCKQTTFLTTNNYPYIEFHHLIPFSTDYGPDHYLNLFGLCPNCHRKMHFISTESKNALYSDLSLNNNMQKTLQNRISDLLSENILEPIHLEFLLKEKIITIEEYDIYMNGEIAV
ncbi:HNH endonuclease [Aliarcobacter cryaerophilus]|uniref:HNH endonuclease n=1 Tax=Aliarcobacter cryaerophilus TaxID=28198 RepID=UPI0021B60AE6|nr:HNH endonuclease [Aliarcobacter cryaerophilus]MCT7497626.1 HNH endonuclease [Aliarcobacter cryaerophilus]